MAFIEPRVSLSGGTATVREVATGALLATIGVASAADVDVAVQAAVEAQPAWAASPAVERAAVLRRAAQALAANRECVVEWLIREGGGIRAKAEHEVASTLDELWVAASLPTRPHGVLLPAEPGRRSHARRVPLGVVGVISPWNFPLLLAMRAVAPALALGNAVVLKPDPRTAVSGGHVIARLFEEADLPADLLQVVPGPADPGRALVAHPAVAMIAFTGSTAVGRQIGERAGGLLKRVSLELGGNNAMIVLADADVDAAASAGAWGAFFHQGQVCMAAGRHIVVAEVAEEYLDRLAARADALRVGDPWTQDVQLGPIIDEVQLKRVRRIVEDTLAGGGVLRAGGGADGLFHRPTVIQVDSPDAPAFAEEVFGPVAPVLVVRDEEEALRVANGVEHGLTAAIRTADSVHGLELAARLRTGVAHVNDQTINDNAFVPFGGRGASGNGTRYGAEQSVEEFTQWQWLTVRADQSHLPF
ncbi:aldehyde dehydrogenase family protein [Kutzneria sp. NPDC052558]|uniref:aldehyde dehydrogenase family protein n=1 Tax=Kutzneria sp. NPDC052558 TaxID=3364121 RepID=UPI0037C8A0D1